MTSVIICRCEEVSLAHLLKTLLQNKAVSLGVVIKLGVSLYDIKQSADGWIVYTSSGVQEVPTLLLATGAAETASPIPGWTLPGVMSIGAAQVMTNVHRVRRSLWESTCCPLPLHANCN